jgi:hypothetical protein
MNEVTMTMSAFLTLYALFSFVLAGKWAMAGPAKVALLPRRG